MVSKVVIVGHPQLASVMYSPNAQMIACPEEMSLREAVSMAIADGTPESSIGLLMPWDIVANVGQVAQQLMRSGYKIVVFVDNPDADLSDFIGVPIADPDSTVETLTILMSQVMGVQIMEVPDVPPEGPPPVSDPYASQQGGPGQGGPGQGWPGQGQYEDEIVLDFDDAPDAPWNDPTAWQGQAENAEMGSQNPPQNPPQSPPQGQWPEPPQIEPPQSGAPQGPDPYAPQQAPQAPAAPWDAPPQPQAPQQAPQAPAAPAAPWDAPPQPRAPQPDPFATPDPYVPQQAPQAPAAPAAPWDAPPQPQAPQAPQTAPQPDPFAASDPFGPPPQVAPPAMPPADPFGPPPTSALEVQDPYGAARPQPQHEQNVYPDQYEEYGRYGDTVPDTYEYAPRSIGEGGTARIDPYSDSNNPTPNYRAQHRAKMAQVHTFAVPKGGTGKSSLAALYAAILSLGLRLGIDDEKSGPRVLLIDANVQQSDSRRIMGLRPQRTMLDLARTVFDDSTIESYLTPPSPANPMWLLSGPINKAEADPLLITPALYRRVTDMLGSRFEHIVIDTPEARLYDPMLADYAMPMTDWLIVPVLQNRLVLDGTKEWLQLIQAPRHVGGYAFEPSKVRLVMNMVRESIGYNTESLSVDLASWEFAGEVAYSSEMARATNEYRLPLDDRPLVESVQRVIYSVTGNPAFATEANGASGSKKKSKRSATNDKGMAGFLKKIISS